MTLVEVLEVGEVSVWFTKNKALLITGFSLYPVNSPEDSDVIYEFVI